MAFCDVLQIEQMHSAVRWMVAVREVRKVTIKHLATSHSLEQCAKMKEQQGDKP